ncbi:MAG TPA: hypothetical protein VN841_20875 [Bryobacteraceae bacterium]|nr:hypothetical protein [Bryobacteraceae bacterium]
MRNGSRRAGAEATALVIFASVGPGLRADRLPLVSQVIDRYVNALGGRAALSKLGPMKLAGPCESSVPDESGPVEILVKTPKVAYNLNGGNLRMGFDGESVWRSAAPEGLQQRKGRQLAELVTVFDPSRALWWKEWYPQMAVTGVRKIDGRDAFVLETFPGSPPTERLFLDRESGLLVRDEVTPQFTFTFSDYRAAEGVTTAFVVQETTPNGISYAYRFESIGPAGMIDESRFQPR